MRFEILFYLLIFSLTLFSLQFNHLQAQELEPRNYAVIPTGMNVGALSYTYSSGSIISQATSPIKDLTLISNSVTAGYVRSFGIFGMLSRIQVGVPFIFLKGTAKLNGKDSNGTRTGFGDSRIRFGINLLGSPALAPQKFVTHKEDFVLGASLVTSVPTGQYSDEKLINLGSNRWGFKPEIGMSYKYSSFYFELYTGIWMYTKNSSYLVNNTITQQPLFTFQSHISFIFPSKIWIAADIGYANGGETSINGKPADNVQNNVRSGFTLSVPIANGHSVKGLFNTGVATRIGGDFTTFSLAYQYSWF